MPEAPKTYSSAQIIMTIDGIPITGYADGDFLSVTQTSPRYTSKTGADGAPTRSKSADRTASATVTLMYGSEGSALLDGYKRLGDGQQPDTFEFVVTDVLSGSTVVSSIAYISEEPDFVAGLEVGTEAWVMMLYGNSIERKPLPIS